MEPRVGVKGIRLSQSPWWLNQNQTVAEVKIEGVDQVDIVPGHHFVHNGFRVESMLLGEPFGQAYEGKGISFRTCKVDGDVGLGLFLWGYNHERWGLVYGIKVQLIFQK